MCHVWDGAMQHVDILLRAGYNGASATIRCLACGGWRRRLVAHRCVRGTRQRGDRLGVCDGPPSSFARSRAVLIEALSRASRWSGGLARRLGGHSCGRHAAFGAPCSTAAGGPCSSLRKDRVNYFRAMADGAWTRCGVSPSGHRHVRSRSHRGWMGRVRGPGRVGDHHTAPAAAQIRSEGLAVWVLGTR